MEIKFSTYNGLAGDLQLLLIAKTDCGIRETVLFDRTSLFDLSLFFARKKLIKRIKNILILLKYFVIQNILYYFI